MALFPPCEVMVPCAVAGLLQYLEYGCQSGLLTAPQILPQGRPLQQSAHLPLEDTTWLSLPHPSSHLGCPWEHVLMETASPQQSTMH
jgi:hypothetical protein